MLKKPALLFSPYCELYAIYNPPRSSCNTPYSLQSSNKASCRSSKRKRSQSRQYATAQNQHSSDEQSSDLPWPNVSFMATPTPYQIFQLKKTAPYSKRRFYELVKLYHPDRHACDSNIPSVHCLPHDVKMRRYRLVVAANDILSDPERRQAYDHCGAGWDGHADIVDLAYRWDPRTKIRWSGFHDNGSIFNNATWEDWEKWYQRNSPNARHSPQSPVYFSNGAFLTLVAFVVGLGAMGQASRVGDVQQSFLERAELIHDDCSKNIQQRQKETRGLGKQDEALQNFVRTRDQSGVPPIGFPEAEQQHPKLFLPPPG